MRLSKGHGGAAKGGVGRWEGGGAAKGGVSSDRLSRVRAQFSGLSHTNC